jgi:hypothetical protein
VVIVSLLLSCDADIYAFGWNGCGEVGNGTWKKQRFPIKLELDNKFIDIASHPYYCISISQSIIDDVIKEFDIELHLKTNGTLTTVGYYIASQIFIQILKGVNHLHK